MTKTSLRASLIACGLLLVWGAADAAGLSKLTVLSRLGEPLRAEIDVVAVDKGELETLNARLASPDAYVQSNLPYPPSSLGLQLSVEQRAGGQPYIRVTSAQPVPEPFVDLLVELSWNGGRILRAYTALLDPPAFAAATPETTAPAPAAAAPTPVPAPKPVAPPAPTAAAPAPMPPASQAAAEAPPAPPQVTEPQPAPAPQPPAPVVTDAPPAEAGMPARAEPESAAKQETYGPVKRGDTLSHIAQGYKSDAVTLEQMLVLLYRNNKEAFIGNNMNRLKTGKVLTIPSAADVASIPASEARKEVRLQVADFNAYRERLAAAAGEVKAAPEDAGKSAGGKVTGPVANKTAPPSGEPKEVLKLSPGAAGGKGAQEQIRSLEEEVAARDKKIRDSNERIAKLEKTVKDMQGLLELKSKPMADLQKPGAAPAPAPAPAVEPPAAAPPTPPAAHPAPPAEATAPPAAAPAAPAAPPKPKAKPKAVDAPPPPSLVDQLMSEPLYLAAGGGILALILALIGYKVAQSKKGKVKREVVPDRSTPDLNPFAPAPLAGDADSTVALNAARAAQAQVNEEVDPLAEAEIYLAYGRDGQAEEILKEALQNNPRRFEIHLKLLQIYAKRKDLAAFEALARSLHQATGGEGDVWLQAARMGYQLDPQNPLYAAGRAGGGEAIPVAAAAALSGATLDKTLDFQIDSLDAAPDIGTLTDFDPSMARRLGTDTNTGRSDNLDLDIGLDEDKAVGTKTDIDLGRLGTDSQSGAMDLDLDLDLDAIRNSAATGNSTDIDLTDLGQRGAGTSTMDFDLELPDAEEKPTAQAAASNTDFDLTLDPVPNPAVTGGQSAGLDFDIGELSLDADAAKPEPMLDLGHAAPTMPEIDLSNISLDLDGGTTPETQTGGPKDDKWYDVQTKFDLAKAYQEMGDKEGAREILREVLAEGDAQQQAAAQQVLGTLG